MKKSIIISALAIMLALSAAGCGQKTQQGSALVDGNVTSTPESTSSSTGAADNAASGNTAEQGGQTDEQYQLEHFAENADEAIDMDKIEGTEAKTDSSGTKGDGKMTTCEVGVDEVKIAEIDGAKVAFIQYNFKNISDSEITFTGDVYSEAYQDGMSLNPAVFPNEIEGYSPESIMQKVAPGKSIKVQKAFTLTDAAIPIEVYVRDTYNESGAESLAQVFLIQ